MKNNSFLDSEENRRKSIEDKKNMENLQQQFLKKRKSKEDDKKVEEVVKGYETNIDNQIEEIIPKNVKNIEKVIDDTINLQEVYNNMLVKISLRSNLFFHELDDKTKGLIKSERNYEKLKEIYKDISSFPKNIKNLYINIDIQNQLYLNKDFDNLEDSLKKEIGNIENYNSLLELHDKVLKNSGMLFDKSGIETLLDMGKFPYLNPNKLGVIEFLDKKENK